LKKYGWDAIRISIVFRVSWSFICSSGPEAEDHTLYSSHTVWLSKRAFEAWTKSEEFRAAHARAGNETTGPLYLEHPKFEGFEVRQTITRKAASA
jgi:heme-degrading monooxygenase HmoA